jgi:predicted membrane-bound mannosyltransferase
MFSGRNGLQYRGQLRIADQGWSFTWSLARYLQLLTVKTYLVTKHSYSKPRILIDTLVRTKQQKSDMRFGTWDVRSLCGAGSLTVEARKLARYVIRFGGCAGGLFG